MGVGRDIRAGAAFVELYVVSNKFNKGLLQAQMKLKAFSQSLLSLGRELVLLGSLASAPFLFAARTFMGFSDAMKVVQAVTGATDKEFESLYETAKLLGKTTSFTAKQAAEGMIILGQAGHKTTTILQMIPSMLNFARATTSELARATQIANDNMKVFRYTADQVEKVVDVLTAGTLNASMNIEDLAEALKYVAPIAVEAGSSLEDTVAAIGALADMGLKGSIAGTSLARAYKNLASTGGAAKVMTELGISVSDAQGNMKPMADLLFEIGNATKNMGSQKRLAIFEEIFGRGQAAALALSTGKGVKNLLAILEKSQGAAEDTAKIIDSGLGGSFRRMMNALEGVQIAIGEALNDALMTAADAIRNISLIISKLIAENKDLIVSVVKGIAAITAFGATLFAIGGTVKLLSFGLSGISLIFSAIGTTVTVVGGILAALLSPIGLLVIALAGATVAVLKFTNIGSAAMNALGKSFAGFSTVAKQVFAGIRDALKQGDIKLAADILWLGLQIAFQSGINTIQKLWIDFKNYLLGVWIDLRAALHQKWVDLWYTMKEGFIQTGLAEPILMVFHAIELAWLRVTNFMAKAWHWVVYDLTRAFQKFAAVWNKIQAGIADSMVSIVAYFEDIDAEELRKEVKEGYLKKQEKLQNEALKTQRDYIKKKQQLENEGQDDIGKLYEKQEKQRQELERLKKLGPEGRRAEALKEKTIIEKDAEKEKKALKEEGDKKISDSMERLKKAKDDLKKLLEKTKVMTPPEKKKLEELKANALQGEKQLEGIGQQIKTKGAFNIENMLGFKGGSTNDEIKKNTASMVQKQDQTNKILKEQKGYIFS